MQHSWASGFVALGMAALVGCASNETKSSQARERLENRFAAKIGRATKADFIEEFGPPQWCRPKETGDETCRFARKVGTKWVGDKNDKTDRRRVEQYDNVVVEFDGYGKLRAFEVDTQR
jgi:allantoicase